MNPILPTIYSAPKFYRVSAEGLITDRDVWEKILVLPDGLFYLERYVISYENYSGNWHISYGFNILNKEMKDVCPLIDTYYLLMIRQFLNTANSPSVMPCVYCQFENKNGTGLSLRSESSYLNDGIKNIFFELNILNETYKGSVMDYIIHEGNNGFIKVSDPSMISIIKRRF